jgi:hypothetical protein
LHAIFSSERLRFNFGCFFCCWFFFIFIFLIG